MVLEGAFGAIPRAFARVVNDAKTRNGLQFAALPYRTGDDGALQIMLITSRETSRWVIPKGWPMKGVQPSRVAEREAYEEAGLVGHIVGDKPIGSYRYVKQLPDAKQRCQVWVFLLQVEHQLGDWPEKAQRETRWFDSTRAASLVAESGLSEIMRLIPLIPGVT